MTILYADTSAVIRAYFADETDHHVLRQLLLDGNDPVLTSELTKVEFASAVSAAFRAKRVDDSSVFLDQFDLDCGANGVLTMLQLEPEVTLSMARHLVTQHLLRALDAIHLAVALTSVKQLAAGEPVAMVTRDYRQAAAAKACGLLVL